VFIEDRKYDQADQILTLSLEIIFANEKCFSTYLNAAEKDLEYLEEEVPQ